MLSSKLALTLLYLLPMHRLNNQKKKNLTFVTKFSKIIDGLALDMSFRHIGQRLFSLLHFSMQNPQKLWEQLRVTGLMKSSWQMIHCSSSASTTHFPTISSSRGSSGGFALLFSTFGSADTPLFKDLEDVGDWGGGVGQVRSTIAMFESVILKTILKIWLPEK